MQGLFVYVVLDDDVGGDHSASNIAYYLDAKH